MKKISKLDMNGFQDNTLKTCSITWYILKKLQSNKPNTIYFVNLDLAFIYRYGKYEYICKSW